MAATDELARRCGIHEKSVDAKGNNLVTSFETKKALLAAMGWPAHDEEAASESLHQLEEKSWNSVLPPVLVVYASRGAVEVPVALAAGVGPVVWTLSLEEGGERSGEANFAELTLLETHDDGERRVERRILRITDELPWGYHRLELRAVEASMSLIVTPGACWLPEGHGQHRFWGIAAQLYLLRSTRNWGIGDFTDLRQLVELAQSKGADVIGLNPFTRDVSRPAGPRQSLLPV